MLNIKPLKFWMTALPLACASSASYGYEIEHASFTGNLDTTLSYGMLTRTSARDADLYCTASGGTAYSCNSDDGNLNYGKGIVSRVAKFTSDLEFNHKSGRWGGFVRVKGFDDSLNNSANDTGRTPLSSDALDLVGSNVDLLDAYMWTSFEINDQPADFRIGNHVLNWGESTFIQGGINVINPVDVAAIRVPGAELREALLPVNMLSLSFNTSDDVSLEGFYQLNWDKTIPDPSGSYFSTNDFGTDGGRKVQLGFGAIADSYGFAKSAFTGDNANYIAQLGTDYNNDEDFLSVPRGADNQPSDTRQWGIAMRVFSEALNDTEFGFYYTRYHSRVPVVSAITGTTTGTANGAAILGNIPLALAGVSGQSRATVGIDAYAETAQYVMEYPDDIELIGMSFNTNAAGWALQGEYSFKNGMPLQIDDTEILMAALTPLKFENATTTANYPNWQINQVGTFNEDTYIRGYIRRNVSQMQATATRLFSRTMGADEFALVGELGVTHVHNMPSKSVLRLEAPGTTTSGNSYHATNAAGAHNGKAATDLSHFADATSWGYRVAGRWTFNNAIRAINLQPRIAYQHDVNGNSPGPGGNFIEGRKALTLGLSAFYKGQWSADLSMTNYYGAGRFNQLNDRDFVSFNVKYSF